MKIALGADHRGLELKNQLLEMLREEGHEVTDVGTHQASSVDYPDFAAEVGKLVAAGQVDRGILMCSSGIGMSIAANKIHGVRAALCHDEAGARVSRQHNDANVLCLAADYVANDHNRSVAATWLATPFEAGRHALRLEKIRQLEP